MQEARASFRTRLRALEGQELMEVIQKVKEYGGNCTLYVTARRDIYSQGPLLIDVRVERNDGR